MTTKLTRRDFLRATLVSVVPLAAAGAGCKGDEGDGGRGELMDGAAFFPQSVASGDPRPDSVILWTRVEDPDLGEDEDATLTVELALDAEFAELVELDDAAATVAARAKFDRCAKAKITGLQPATTYYYRFILSREDGDYVGPVGRTRTAPDAEADVTVRFAYASCQDFNGRYYNSYRGMLGLELDFFVHLGDYVYETTGDPTFQATGKRAITFSDTAGAIVFHEGEEDQYYAAKSLDNYRELYRQYRSDPALRRVHETLPMIAVWDDHEFSDDCFGATATYFDGRVDERDEQRRKHANQAWFEYMPVDFGDPAYEYDPSKAPPDDIKIYREFRFGKHLHLVMTDLRSYKSDHLIPEDAFPGAVILTEAEVPAELQPAMVPYVDDIEGFMGGVYAEALRAGATELGYDPAKITGPIDAQYINDLLVKLGGAAPAIDDVTLGGLPKGLAFRHAGKLGFHASIGSRYLVIKPVFEAWVQKRAKADPNAVNVMGAAQEKWFLDTMKGSDATFKVWGTEYTLMPLVIDLRALPVEPFDQLFLMNVDQWDGFFPTRDRLLGELQAAGNVVAITGDIHAFYAGTPMVGGAPDKKIVEFVGSGISSTTFQSLLVLQVAADPTLSSTPGADMLAAGIDTLFTGAGTNPHLAYARSNYHGFVSVEVEGAELRSTFHMLPEEVSETDYAGKEDLLAGKFERLDFKVKAGERELYAEIAGAWKRWDPSANTWV